MYWIISLLSMIFVTQPKTPEDLRWKNRILVISNVQAEGEWFNKANNNYLETRKLLVFYFEEGRLKNSNFPDSINSTKFLEKLQNQRGVENWVLIGLDGGVKDSGKDMPNLKAVFQTIDAMPMRQSEIRKKKGWEKLI
jgi:hypothetical protein